MFRHETPIPEASAQALFQWHESPQTFVRLTPPWEPVTLERVPASLQNGQYASIRIPLLGRWGRHLPLALHWKARHEGYQPPEQFVDVQESGPFAYWKHVHRCMASPTGGTILQDDITYRLPLSALSEPVANWSVQAKLARMFRYRHRITRYDMQRKAVYAPFMELSPYNSAGQQAVVLITGASGMVGKALVAFLLGQGFRVRVLQRTASATSLPLHGVDVWHCDAQGGIPEGVFEGVAGIITLNGAPIAQRHTPAYERLLWESRVNWNQALVQACLAQHGQPECWIGASGLGMYAPEHSFMGKLNRAWEATLHPLQERGIRVAHLRLGIVIDESGGYMERLQPLSQLGGVWHVGPAQAPMPWVSLEDVLGIVQHLLLHTPSHGAYDVVAPGTTTQQAFHQAWAEAMHMPFWGKLPEALLRPVYGNAMVERVFQAPTPVLAPERLVEEGFTFLHPTTATLLEHTTETRGLAEWLMAKL
jgi:uncharacterized protein